MVLRLSFGVVLVVSLIVGGCAAEQKTQAPLSNKPVLDAYVAAWNHHDSVALDTLLAKDGIHEDVASHMRLQGAAAVNGLLRDFIKSEPDFDWKMTNVFEDGPMLAAEWTWTATFTGASPSGPVTAMRITGRGSSIAEVADGKIKRFTDYYDESSFFPPVKTDSSKAKPDATKK